MVDYMTINHIGIITVVIGTVFLAFSVKVKRQYQGDIANTVDRLKKENPELLEPTETSINPYLFWFGLFLVAVGSILQW